MRLERLVTGNTDLAAVIGNPISHTLSPYIHNTFSRETGTALVYIPLHVRDASAVGDAVSSLKTLGAKGLNITVPYKAEIMRHIDIADKAATEVGAVNTVAFREDGIYGSNTDIYGFLKGYSRDTGEDLRNKRVAIIGAGGTSRSVAYAAAHAAASAVVIMNRTVSRAREVADMINTVFHDTDAVPYPLISADAADILSDCDVIVNTTALGMHPFTEANPLPEGFRPRNGQIFYDVVYNPERTLFLKSAEDSGCKTANGLSMLLYQAAESFKIWMRVSIDDILTEQVRRALEKMLKEGVA